MQSTTAVDVIRVWIDDRHPIFRRGVRACLAIDGMSVVGEGSGFEPTPASSTDVVIFEAEHGGLRQATQLRAESGVRTIAIAADDDERLLHEAIDAGVSAIHFRWDVSPESLVASVLAAVRDDAVLPKDLLTRLLRRAAVRGGPSTSTLQPRELAVLELLAKGEDTRDIASQLSYSERTVKNIVHDLLMKLNCRNRAHAVGLATRQGII